MNCDSFVGNRIIVNTDSEMDTYTYIYILLCIMRSLSLLSLDSASFKLNLST